MAVSVLTQKKSTPEGNPVDKLLASTAGDMAKVNALILSRAEADEVVALLAPLIRDFLAEPARSA